MCWQAITTKTAITATATTTTLTIVPTTARIHNNKFVCFAYKRKHCGDDSTQWHEKSRDKTRKTHHKRSRRINNALALQQVILWSDLPYVWVLSWYVAFNTQFSLQHREMFVPVFACSQFPLGHCQREKLLISLYFRIFPCSSTINFCISPFRQFILLCHSFIQNEHVKYRL